MKNIGEECRQFLQRFVAHTTLSVAQECLRQLVITIGPGFHPDSRLGDYVHPDGSTLFADSEITSLTPGFEQLLTFLDDSGIAPCEIAMPVQHRLLGKL